MKFLHLADLHIGKTVNDFPMIADQRYALEQIVEFVEDSSNNRIDAVLIAGDLYDKTSPSAEAVALVDWFLTELSRAGVACFAIPGNHDSAERVGYASGMLENNGIYLAGPYQGELAHQQMEDEFGSVDFWLLPFVRPANVRGYFPNDEIGTSYTAALRAIINHSAIDFAKRNVILSHQFVSFGTVKPETSDSEIASVGGLDEVSSAVFDGFDYVALGHIHKSQAIATRNIRYSGSLLKYSFSEARQEKAFPIVTLREKGSAQIDELRLKPLHDLREVSGPLDELTSPKIAASAPTDDYLHVILTDDHPIINALQRLRSVYPNIMSMDYQNTLNRSSRTQHRIPNIDKNDFSPEKLFEKFYEEQFGGRLTKLQRSIVSRELSRCLDDEASESTATKIEESMEGPLDETD